jgi:hypothetical protein
VLILNFSLAGSRAKGDVVELRVGKQGAQVRLGASRSELSFRFGGSDPAALYGPALLFMAQEGAVMHTPLQPLREEPWSALRGPAGEFDMSRAFARSAQHAQVCFVDALAEAAWADFATCRKGGQSCIGVAEVSEISIALDGSCRGKFHTNEKG